MHGFLDVSFARLRCARYQTGKQDASRDGVNTFWQSMSGDYRYWLGTGDLGSAADVAGSGFLFTTLPRGVFVLHDLSSAASTRFPALL